MAKAQLELIERLVTGLQPDLHEHLAVAGDVIPHAFFVDVTHYAMDLYRRKEEGDLQARMELTDLLQELEKSFSADVVDGPVDNLIAVSFVEGLPAPSPQTGGIGERLCPRVQAHYQMLWAAEPEEGA